MARNAAFYEACSNYEEICTWLATRKRRPKVEDPVELDQARALKRDLEDEILDLLEDRSDIIK